MRKPGSLTLALLPVAVKIVLASLYAFPTGFDFRTHQGCLYGKEMIKQRKFLIVTIFLFGLILSAPTILEAAKRDNWFFVRQSVTWANRNSIVADEIITKLKNAGLLDKEKGKTNITFSIGFTKYKAVIEVGCASCKNISSTSYAGKKSYANRFKMWRAKDNIEALEMLFTNVNSENSMNSNGILLIYRLAVVSPLNSNNQNLIIESYISGTTPSRKQTYSWSEPIWVAPHLLAATTTDAGRVVLEEMSFGLVGGGVVNGLGAKIAVRTVSQTTVCGTGPHYYTLAYMQKFETPFQTTALEGLAVDRYPTKSTLCGYDIVKFGIFNKNGFVKDNLTAMDIPEGYPTPGATYGVQAEFNKIGAVPSGGKGSYDALQKNTIDTLNITFRSANDFP